jgi:hypothetical protein
MDDASSNQGNAAEVDVDDISMAEGEMSQESGKSFCKKITN